MLKKTFLLYQLNIHTDIHTMHNALQAASKRTRTSNSAKQTRFKA